MDLAQPLAAELKLDLTAVVHVRHTPCWREIKDRIRAFKYPVGYIAINAGHPYQMASVQGKKGYIIIIFSLWRNDVWTPPSLVLCISSVNHVTGVILFLFPFLPTAWGR